MILYSQLNLTDVLLQMRKDLLQRDAAIWGSSKQPEISIQGFSAASYSIELVMFD